MRSPHCSHCALLVSPERSYDYMAQTPEDIKARVAKLIEPKPGLLEQGGACGPSRAVQAALADIRPSPRSRRIDDVAHQRVCALAGRLFCGIRFFFVKCAKNKLNAFFLDPVYAFVFLFVFCLLLLLSTFANDWSTGIRSWAAI